MAQYVLRRLLAAIPTLFLVIALAFFMMHAAPGGPFDQERQLPPPILEALNAHYHLDEPVIVQFGIYLKNLVRGDLGPSYRLVGRNVNELIADAWPQSFKVGGMAMLCGVLLGIAAGSVAALRQNTLADRFVMGFAMTGISIPIFVIAPLLILLFAVKLNWLPAGWSAREDWTRMVMPVAALALPQLAYVARLTRASMIDVLASGYIRTARAQGLSTWEIVRYHALKPAMLPVVSYLGPAVAAILTGSVVIEQVFGINGIGYHFVTSALNRDYTVVLGVVIFYAVLLIVMNLIVDLLYAAIDPRVRHR